MEVPGPISAVASPKCTTPRPASTCTTSSYVWWCSGARPGGIMPANCVNASPSLSRTRNSRSPVRSGSQSSSVTTRIPGRPSSPSAEACTATATASSPAAPARHSYRSPSRSHTAVPGSRTVVPCASASRVPDPLITYQASPCPPAVPVITEPPARLSRRWCSPRQPSASPSIARTVTPGAAGRLVTCSGVRTAGVAWLLMPWTIPGSELRVPSARVVLGQDRGRPDKGPVRLADDLVVLAVVVELREHVLDRLEPGPLLVVALDHGPRRLGRVGVVEHRLLGLGVRVPLVQRLDVHRAQLPLPYRVDPPDDEPGALRRRGHREPELRQAQPRAHQHVLEGGRLPHELLVVLLRAEPHHPLDAGAVVPRAVEHDDLARRGQVRDVPLQVPLRLLALTRPGQRHHRGPARVQVLGEPLDRPALAGRIAALEHDYDPLPGGLHPVLQLDELDLERALEVLVLAARHLLVVRVVLAPGVDHPAVRPAQDRVVMLVVVVHHQARYQDGIGRPVRRQRVERVSCIAGHATSTAHHARPVTPRPAIARLNIKPFYPERRWYLPRAPRRTAHNRIRARERPDGPRATHQPRQGIRARARPRSPRATRTPSSHPPRPGVTGTLTLAPAAPRDR